MVSTRETATGGLRSTSIRVGVIGVGFGAAVHIPALQFLPETEVAAVCARRAERAHLAAAQYGVKVALSDFRVLLRDESIDAVVIATPPHLHHQMSLAAIDAGKHVLCEKPMARTLAEARDMVKLADSNGVVAMVNHEFRFSPDRARAKELIDEGYLGDPQSASIVVYRSSLNDPNGATWDWLMESTKGGGMLGAAGSHFADALRWWFGDIKSVAGVVATMVKRRRLPESTQTAPVDADDNFSLMLRFANGALGTVHYSATAPHDSGDEIVLSGSNGMLVMPGDGRLLGGRRGETLAELPLPDRLSPAFPDFAHPSTGPTVLLLREWIRAIRTGVPASPSFADGVKVQEILDGVVRSTQQNRWVEVQRGRFQV
jgi:predicted dehydrogenase